jgi:hypothetical protein
MQTQDRLEDLIGAIAADPALHARWLNTLSYLEYVGFRKIVKSQRAEVLTAAILGHACEEGRHALGLKKLAIKLGGVQFDSYAPAVLLCSEEAAAYFQDLDKACDEAFAGRSEAARGKSNPHAFDLRRFIRDSPSLCCPILRFGDGLYARKGTAIEINGISLRIRYRQDCYKAWWNRTGWPCAGVTSSPSHMTRWPRIMVPTGQPCTSIPS